MVLVIDISFLCFISFLFYFILFFVFQKAENNRLKKASLPKFCNIIFSFLRRIESVGPVDQQTNLVWPYFLLFEIKHEKRI